MMECLSLYMKNPSDVLFFIIDVGYFWLVFFIYFFALKIGECGSTL